MNRPRNLDTRRLVLTSSAIFLTLFAAWYLLGGIFASSPNMSNPTKAKYHFETVPGIFMQSDPATDWKDFDYTKSNFGLIDRTYPTDSDIPNVTKPWSRFTHYLQHLTSTGEYKLLIFGRHGEGDHNVAEAFYGTEAWDDYWSKLEGNGSVVWADAHLTKVGEEQAREAGKFVQREMEVEKMPTPEVWIVTPMFRCLQTAQLTWPEPATTPVIKELLREVLGEHTCDRRSTRTYIHSHYPEWTIEAGFSEDDELWRADHRETHDEHDLRTQAFLEDVWANEGKGKKVLSLTSHSGAIASHLRVLGHREFRLPTGGMIPILVKGTKMNS